MKNVSKCNFLPLFLSGAKITIRLKRRHIFGKIMQKICITVMAQSLASMITNQKLKKAISTKSPTIMAMKVLLVVKR